LIYLAYGTGKSIFLLKFLAVKVDGLCGIADAHEVFNGEIFDLYHIKSLYSGNTSINDSFL
jgi:hypothetical protein